MPTFIQVLLLSLLPAAGNFIGGVVAEFARVSDRALNRALHAASGIVVAVVAIEIVPEALAGASAVLIVIAFCLGGVAYIVLDRGLGAILGGSGEQGPWMIYAAVAIDLFSDGLMVGIGSTVSIGLALVLAIGQVTADLPEGFAAVANLRKSGISRTKRILLASSFAFASLLGATVGFWLLRDQDRTIQLAALAFVGGILLLAAVEDMLNEAHDASADASWSSASFIGGFALFTLISSYLG